MKIYLRLLSYLKPYWKAIILFLLCLQITALLGGANLGVIIPFLKVLFSHSSFSTVTDTSIPQTAGKIYLFLKIKFNQFFFQVSQLVALKRLCLLILMLFLLKNVFGYLMNVISIIIEQRVLRDIRYQIYEHLHTLSLSFFHKRRTGELVSRINNDVNTVKGAVAIDTLMIVRQAVQSLVYLVVAFWAAWRLALLAVLLLPSTAILAAILSRKLRKRSHRMQEKMADITSVLVETISGIRVVKAFTMEKDEKRKFRHHINEYLRAHLRFEWLSSLAGPLTEVVACLAAIIILWYGGIQILETKTLSPERFFVFLAAILSMISPLNQISKANSAIQTGIAAGQRIFKILETKPEILDRVGAKEIKGIYQSIVLEDVSFEYETGKPVLQNINLKIKIGEVAALVGPSGAGKSTLSDLIARFYEPTRGKIKVDEIDFQEFTVASWRRLIGLVPQETILFNDTIYNNIAYSRKDARKEEVIGAAKAANAQGFILQLPEGYETIVGERGVRLSGGEKQRIAVARAILKNPPLLILDEATSALDSESERLVQEALKYLMQNRTTLVIAHRLSTVKRADKIIVLENGKIVEVGTHHSLIQKQGPYQRLYEMQFMT
ncbi:MAG: ABC transporter ATP-binding protein [Candidatus Edwardsbacteria bacterium]